MLIRTLLVRSAADQANKKGVSPPLPPPLSTESPLVLLHMNLEDCVLVPERNLVPQSLARVWEAPTRMLTDIPVARLSYSNHCSKSFMLNVQYRKNSNNRSVFYLAENHPL